MAKRKVRVYVQDPNRNYFQNGGTSRDGIYIFQDKKYKKVDGEWQKEIKGKYHKLTKGDIAKRSAVLDAQAKRSDENYSLNIDFNREDGTGTDHYKVDTTGYSKGSSGTASFRYPSVITPAGGGRTYYNFGLYSNWLQDALDSKTSEYDGEDWMPIQATMPTHQNGGNIYQNGGGMPPEQAMQPGMDQGMAPQQDQQQEQLMMLIQQFAQITGQDPQVIIEQLQQLPEEQIQQAIQEMAQTVEQGQGQEMAGPPMEQPPMEQQMIARNGGDYMKEYSKKMNKLMKKEAGGISNTNESYNTVQEKLKKNVESAIGLNFTNNMIDETGESFMNRASQPNYFADGGYADPNFAAMQAGFQNPFMQSYDAANTMAAAEQDYSGDLFRERLGDVGFVNYEKNVLRGAVDPTTGKRAKASWRNYGQPGIENLATAQDGLEVWDYQNFDALRGMLEKKTDQSLDPNLSEGELFAMAGREGLLGTRTATPAGGSKSTDVANYYNTNNTGSDYAASRAKLKGDLSKVFENARVTDIEKKYGLFGRPNESKGRLGSPKKTTMRFGYDQVTGAPTTGGAQPDAADQRLSELEKVWGVGNVPDWAKVSSDVFPANPPGMTPTPTVTPETTETTEATSSNIDDKGRLISYSERAIKNREMKDFRRENREARQLERRENRTGANDLIQGTSQYPVPTVTPTPISGLPGYLQNLSPAEREAMLQYDPSASTPNYLGGGELPYYQDGDQYDRFGAEDEAIWTMQNKMGLEGQWEPAAMAGISNFADMMNAQRLKEQEGMAYNAAMNNPYLPGDYAGAFGQAPSGTTGSVFPGQAQMAGVLPGRFGAATPGMYGQEQYPYRAQEGGSMGGYNLNQPVYMEQDEIEFILKNGGKVEYY